MTKNAFQSMTLDELIEWGYENLNDITHEDILKEYGVLKIQEDNFGLGLHVLNAIYNNDTLSEYYLYDYSMGTLETPTPITCKEDLEHLIDFE